MNDDLELISLREGCAEFVRMQKELCDLLNEGDEGDSIALHERIVWGIKALKEQIPEGWQPIETKRPGRVLLWFPQLGYPVTGDSEIYSYQSGGWKATHWMPLPSPPQPGDER